MSDSGPRPSTTGHTVAAGRTTLPGNRLRAAAGVVLGAVAVLLALAVLSGAPDAVRSTGDTPHTGAWVYRVDTRDLDGNWTVYAWGVAGGPRREAMTQTANRACRRGSRSHRCRATVVAEFRDRGSAQELRRTLCRNHRQESHRLPEGMRSCEG